MAREVTALAAFAVKLALVAPVPIVTDAGTVSAAFPLDRLTTVLDNAALDSVTVQVELPGGVKALGLQLTAESTGVTGLRPSGPKRLRCRRDGGDWPGRPAVCR